MQRRSFIKSLITLCIAPQVLIPKEPINWKRQKNLYIPNPDYKDAAYEVAFIYNALPFYLAKNQISYHKKCEEHMWYNFAQQLPAPIFTHEQIMVHS